MPATHNDAVLVVQLVRWGTEMGLVEATGALFASDFDPAAASANDSSVSKMLTFGETVATLVKHGVLNKELVDDLWWAPGAWAQVAARAEENEPSLYENFEAHAAQAG